MQRIFKYGGIQNIIVTPDKELIILIYSVSQKKVAPLKLFAVLSLLVNLCN